MSPRRLFFLVALSALSIGSTVAIAEPLFHANQSPNDSLHQPLAQAPREQRNQSRERGKKRFLEQLNLSDAQKQQLGTIRQKYYEQMRQKSQSLRTERQALREMMVGTASASDIRSQHAEVAKLDQELKNIRFESMLEMREVLTPEQRRKFTEIMQQRRESFRRDNNPDKPQSREEKRSRTNRNNPQSREEKRERNNRNNPQSESEGTNAKNTVI